MVMVMEKSFGVNEEEVAKKSVLGCQATLTEKIVENNF
jgi:hypothetical protein